MSMYIFGYVLVHACMDEAMIAPPKKKLAINFNNTICSC